MRMDASKKPGGFTENTERRNCRRAVIALSLIAIAAIGRAARTQDGADADIGHAVGAAYSVMHVPSVARAGE